MADFSSHHSLLLKMPATLTNGHSANLPGLLFYNQSYGGQEAAAAAAASANANAASGGAAAMAENASLERNSAVVDTSPQASASPMDRKRKTPEGSATLTSDHSKVATNIHNPALPFSL
jgi:BHLH transcription factor Upa20